MTHFDTRQLRRTAAIDWVIPAAAALGVALAGLAALHSGAPLSEEAPAISQASILPVAGMAAPGSPRVAMELGAAHGAVERCDAVTGQCRTLPVEDRLYRMTDGTEWTARTAFDDQGRIAYTLWYDHDGAMVGTPRGL